MESYVVKFDDGFKHQELAQKFDIEWDQLSAEIWSTARGVTHRENGPAIILRDKESGKQVGELWYRHGKLHREDGPAVCIEFRNGMGILREWHRDGEYHRERGPSKTYEHLTDSGWFVGGEYWHRDGQLHRLGGPAVMHRDTSGVITYEQWYENGIPHRLHGPQSTERNSRTGIAEIEEWYVHGEQHRTDGPASLRRDPDSGEITHQWFVINDVEVQSLTLPFPKPGPG